MVERMNIMSGVPKGSELTLEQTLELAGQCLDVINRVSVALHRHQPSEPGNEHAAYDDEKMRGKMLAAFIRVSDVRDELRAMMSA